MRQMIRRAQEMGGRHGIAEDIPAPFQFELRRNLQAHVLDLHVVTFTRPEHEPVRPEADGRFVTVGRLVNDAQPVHRPGGNALGGACSTVTFIVLSCSAP